ncbi:MAG: hypothetical protein JOZ81_31220 [Chloroflexi bacterium]|nr:hypothetical protein [Chloroflexota bacterium]
MRSSFILRLATVAIVLCSLALAPVWPDLTHGAPAPAAYAASPLAWQQKGFTMASWATNDLSNAGPALDQLAATGANSVTFVVTWYQSTSSSTSIQATSATASDASLISAMQYARSRGLNVNLKPHVERMDGGWRATINPSDINAWFGLSTAYATSGTSYAAMVTHYADLLQQYGTSNSVLVIGAELITVATNTTTDPTTGACISTGWNSTPLWSNMISTLRSHFSGKLTYSANWGSGCWATEFSNIPFWSALDFIGISGYFPVANAGQTPTVSSMDAAWNTWISGTVAPFQQKIGKPVMFTEIGYRSATGTAAQPFDDWDTWPQDFQQQSDCYEALFESWGNVPSFVGVAGWLWDVNASYPANTTTYQVQNKPAQSLITSWFSAAAPAATPTTTATASAGAPSISIRNPQSNQTYSGTITVQAAAANASTVAYDVDGGAQVAMTLNSVNGLWQATLNTTTLSNGTHNVDVVNYGSNGATATDRAWNIQVSNSGAPATATPTATATSTPRTATPTPTATSSAGPPSISIRNPQSNQTYSGTITVQASAANASTVAYDVDGGAQVAMTLNSANGLWQATLNTTTLSNGAHNVDVVNHGSNGATATDRAWNIKIAN